MNANRQHEVVVWVPTGRVANMIRSGSGVVSTEPPNQGGYVTIDMEGNLYGSFDMEVFANRVFHAHDRQAANYPTIARMLAPVASLQRVGMFDAEEGVVSLDDPAAVEDNRAVLAAWLGKSDVEDADLVATGGHYERLRIVKRLLASPDPAQREQGRWFAREAGISLPLGR